MATPISYSVAQQDARTSDPYKIATSTQSPSAGDVELRFDASKVTKHDVILACELFAMYLNDGTQDGSTKPPL